MAVGTVRQEGTSGLHRLAPPASPTETDDGSDGRRGGVRSARVPRSWRYDGSGTTTDLTSVYSSKA
jgi:hypothetical protein